MKVLIIVDVQNDFCPGGSLGVDGAHDIIPAINQLMESKVFDLVIATRDWHPATHVSFDANHPGARCFSTIETEYGLQVLWPIHAVQQTKGGEFHPELKTAGINYIVDKGTDPRIDSYSGFFDNGKLKETHLRSLIENEALIRGVPRAEINLSICGLALDFCVAATARDARTLGFNTELIVDATRAVCLNPGDDIKTLRELQVLGVEMTAVRDLVVHERPVSRDVVRNLEA